jgi:nucleotide-binding universal stress UspA family protein
MTMGGATGSRRVVVGYDGSPDSDAALQRAADAAGDDGVVFVVHAYPRPRGWFGAPDDEDRLAAVLEAAEARMRALCDDAGGPLSRVAWEREIVPGDPAGAIAAVAAARQADEIVVGSRRFGPARALLGSVAHDLIRIAGVPVTVIPHGAAPRAGAA